jgi:hypothetical protein
MKLADLVGAVVQRVRPENVDAAGMTVSGEGPEVEIVILPHRDLDGVSLVVMTDRRSARLLWAHVGDLSYHDDLDLGVVVESFLYEGTWRARLQEAIAAELSRPIRVQSRKGLFGRPHVECSIVMGDRDRRIGAVRLPRDREGEGVEMTTTLAGGPRPPFSVPPAITRAG